MLAILLISIATAELTGKVVSVTDGDSLTILVDGTQVKIRLAGIDAPERKQPFGTRAREHLAGLVHEREVRLVSAGRDRYGRTLGVVWVDGVNVNEAMVEDGMAWQYRRYDRSKRLEELESDARANRRGLWVDPMPVEPWDWRRATH